ncbi:protein of unknown function [Vibrio tapetis subsp. tapetis]|uniref:Uncharacterized protein n=1 Tax=Vibrio tapetis subsp. tapetis TaxID=1671868 RepID=A0A2N8Z9V3_9VIBR|nr:protein of unknown function [Vibrio tapetis subsp. tapetis]
MHDMQGVTGSSPVAGTKFVLSEQNAKPAFIAGFVVSIPQLLLSVLTHR